MLHVTNGDAAGTLLKRAGVPGYVLPWRDVLHEGPAPAGLSHAELRATRARYIADAGWAPYDEALADLLFRVDALARAPEEHGEVVLWFEHDLYDQLQLLQILDRYEGKGERDKGQVVAPVSDPFRLSPFPLSLVCIGTFPGVEPFLGLGQLSLPQIGSLLEGRAVVTPAVLRLGREAWGAFRSPDPRGVERQLGEDTSALPFLRGALLRLLEQLPWTRDGLSRSERQVLRAVEAGARAPVEVFLAQQELEEAPFMGDLVVWTTMRGLTAGRSPLLALEGGGAFQLSPASGSRDAFDGQRIALTDAGRAVLSGEADHARLNGLDRWLGGVHLVGRDPAWRWDGGRRRVAAREGR